MKKHARHLTLAAAAAAAATAAVVSAMALMGTSGCNDKADAALVKHKQVKKRLIVLGVDGMDPRLLDRYMREGRTPNLSKLAKEGTYMRLGTTFPPQSPVAWSTFITGNHSGGHGIYDFVHRDPDALAPYLSTSKTESANYWGTLGSVRIPDPFSESKIELLRAGRAFWQDLEEEEVPATVVKVPANFPPADSKVNESMAGMGTPDVLGTYGTFQYYSDDPADAERKFSGGIFHALSFDQGERAQTRLDGPPDPLSATDETMTVDVSIVRDRERGAARLRVGDSDHILQPGEWTEWIPVGFDVTLSGDLPGMVRFFLSSLEPHTKLYASPVNIDPTAPAMPLSAPASYVDGLAADVGRFYTQGMPEDTKALAAGALSDDEFLAQAELVWEERMKLLERELNRYQGGVLFFYFSSIDMVSHVFFRALAPDAAPEDARYAHIIPDLYHRIDKVIGDVIERVGPEADVIVMSDHGFAHYRYKVHLNTWLAQQGYLSLLPPEAMEPGPLGHIDWANTQAYAYGLNQLFINLQGREAKGVVPAEEYDVLRRRLIRQLEAFRDPNTGANVVTEAVIPEPGLFKDREPDLLIGYNRGYRSSDESALGRVGELVIETNRDKWSGDHCMHPSHVPGVLLTNRKVEVERASLLDLAPTILSYFNVNRSASMTGTPLWNPDTPSKE